MGVCEVGHRAFRWFSQKREELLITLGSVPVPPCVVGPKLPLFPRVDGWLAVWQRHYRIDEKSLDRLLQGKIDFFGHPPLDVGMPVDWHRDPVTGIRAPLYFGKKLNYRDDTIVGNVKFTWELGRHQHLIPLAAAYACTGDRRYRDAVAAQIESWIRDNPYGLGIHWCSALEVSLRLISWAVVHSLLAMRDGEEGLFSALENKERLGVAIYQQAMFVRNYLSRYSSANNHLIGELTGLWVVSQVFDMGKAGERLAKFAQAELEHEAQQQIYEDGVDKEQALYYHLWVLEYLLFAWLAGERCGRSFSDDFRKRIVGMAKFLRDVTPAGGQPPQVGDSDDGFVTRFEPVWPHTAYGDVLAAVNITLGSKDVDMPQKAFWYGMLRGKLPSEDERGEEQAPYPRIYRSGGYAVLGAGPVHLVFDAGLLGYPSIAAHGHADALSFCLAVDGDWWLVDPGTYAYHSEHGWRDYFRGTVAHNTLVVDGANQSAIGGPFLWLQHARGRLIDVGTDPAGVQWAAGTHDGYVRLGATHTRRIELSAQGDKITISDEVGGNSDHEMAIHFHFAPDIELSPGPQPVSWQIFKPGSEHRALLQVDEAWCWEAVRGSESPKLGWYSPSLGVKVPVFTLRGTRRTRLPVQTVTRILVQ